ncbi:hypothetical protein BT63DRAFT_449771 [Microthyrium microscopicum]|uniref:Uncharacterized protein n=1 Tax=Microthyrium microscopicum TaxID=703497 RepID=A0A6A6UTL0_9PEZI|nr:hypothetical protein BT63DRAFT_449771 [Microthyrium microscopicum]
MDQIAPEIIDLTEDDDVDMTEDDDHDMTEDDDHDMTEDDDIDMTEDDDDDMTESEIIDLTGSDVSPTESEITDPIQPEVIDLTGTDSESEPEDEVSSAWRELERWAMAMKVCIRFNKRAVGSSFAACHSGTQVYFARGQWQATKGALKAQGVFGENYERFGSLYELAIDLAQVFGLPGNKDKAYFELDSTLPRLVPLSIFAVPRAGDRVQRVPEHTDAKARRGNGGKALCCVVVGTDETELRFGPLSLKPPKPEDVSGDSDGSGYGSGDSAVGVTPHGTYFGDLANPRALPDGNVCAVHYLDDIRQLLMENWDAWVKDYGVSCLGEDKMRFAIRQKYYPTPI